MPPPNGERRTLDSELRTPNSAFRAEHELDSPTAPSPSWSPRIHEAALRSHGPRSPPGTISATTKLCRMCDKVSSSALGGSGWVPGATAGPQRTCTLPPGDWRVNNGVESIPWIRLNSPPLFLIKTERPNPSPARPTMDVTAATVRASRECPPAAGRPGTWAIPRPPAPRSP